MSYWNKFDKRLNEIVGEVDSNKVNQGSMRAVLIIIPLVMLFVLFESFFKLFKKSEA